MKPMVLSLSLMLVILAYSQASLAQTIGTTNAETRELRNQIVAHLQAGEVTADCKTCILSLNTRLREIGLTNQSSSSDFVTQLMNLTTLNTSRARQVLQSCIQHEMCRHLGESPQSEQISTEDLSRKVCEQMVHESRNRKLEETCVGSLNCIYIGEQKLRSDFTLPISSLSTLEKVCKLSTAALIEGSKSYYFEWCRRHLETQRRQLREAFGDIVGNNFELMNVVRYKTDIASKVEETGTFSDLEISTIVTTMAISDPGISAKCNEKFENEAPQRSDKIIEGYQTLRALDACKEKLDPSLRATANKEGYEIRISECGPFTVGDSNTEQGPDTSQASH
jgi:hypothetical protein